MSSHMCTSFMNQSREQEKLPPGSVGSCDSGANGSTQGEHKTSLSRAWQGFPAMSERATRTAPQGDALPHFTPNPSP